MFNVLKRDGSSQEFRVSEIKKKISEVSILIPEKIRTELVNEIEARLSQFMKPGMKTSKIQDNVIDCLKDFIDIDKPYMEYAAGKAVFQKIYHEVFKSTKIRTYPSNINDYDSYYKLGFKEYVYMFTEKSLLAPNLVTDYTEDQITELSEYIDYSRDNNFKWMGINTLAKRYLLKNKGKLVEVPQWRFMVISMYVASNESTPEKRVKYAKEYYDAISNFLFIPATPTMSNGGKIRHQLSSCFISRVADSIEGIFDYTKEFAEYSKYSGGAAVDITPVRAYGGAIQQHKNASSGIVPWMKVFNNTAVSVNQLGCVAKDSYIRVLDSITIDGVEYTPDQIVKDGKTALESINDFRDVELESSVISIQDAYEGQYVYSFNIEKVDNEFNKILKVHDDIVVKHEDQIKIYLDNKDQYVITSKWHPILCEINSSYEYVRSDEVKVGDKIVSEFGLSSVIEIDLDPKEDPHYFDLTVDKVNNYFCITHDPEGDMHVIHNTRNGSLAIHLELWHADLIRFLEARRNNTDDRKRAGDIFPGVIIPDLFMKRLADKGNWSLFDPHHNPELLNCWGDEWEKRYLEAEERGDAVATYSCAEIRGEIFKNIFETGMPYVTFKDNMNRQNRHPELGMIHSSNLCCFTGDTKVLIHPDDNLSKVVTIKELASYTSINNKVGIWTLPELHINEGKPTEFVSRYGFAFSQGVKSIVKVTLSDGSSFRCTPDHRVFIRQSDDTFIEKEVGECLNERLYTIFETNDPEVRDELTQSLEIISIEEAGEEEVFDISVDDIHRFVVITKDEGTELRGILVHNCEIALPTQENSYLVRVTKYDGSIEEYPYDSFAEKYNCIANNITVNHAKDIEFVEIITVPGETAVCNLGSVNLLRYHKLERENRKKLIYTAVRFLDSVIDKNFYLTRQSKNGALRTRAIGLGIMNEHGLIASKAIMYGSEQHKAFIHDLYEEFALFSDAGSEVLNEELGKTGRKNHYVRAIAPTGSISLIAGSTQGIDPVYKRKWNEENSLGASQPILAPDLSPDTFAYYINAYEVDPEDLVELNAIRQNYIDQAISFTMYIDPEKQYVSKDSGKVISVATKLNRIWRKAWESGIKTIYYTRSKSPEIKSNVSADGQTISDSYGSGNKYITCEGCQ